MPPSAVAIAMRAFKPQRGGKYSGREQLKRDGAQVKNLQRRAPQLPETSELTFSNSQFREVPDFGFS